MSAIENGIKFVCIMIMMGYMLSLFSAYPANLLSFTSTVSSADDDLFTTYPHRGIYRYKNYFENNLPVDAKLPLHVRNANFTIIGAYADLWALRNTISEGEGPYPNSADFEPLILESKEHGKRGAVFVWLAKYADIDLHPYEEIVFCMSVVTKGQPNTLQCVDDGMCLVDAFASNKQSHCSLLYLSADLPIAYGREILGTNKHKMTAQSTIQPGKGYQVKNTYDYEGIFQGAFNLDLNPLGGFLLFPRMAVQLGFRKAFKLAWDTLNEHSNDFILRFSRGVTTIIDSEKFFPEVRFVGKIKELATEVWNTERHSMTILDKAIIPWDLKPAVVMAIVRGKGVFFPPYAGQTAVGVKA